MVKVMVVMVVVLGVKVAMMMMVVVIVKVVMMVLALMAKVVVVVVLQGMPEKRRCSALPWPRPAAPAALQELELLGASVRSGLGLGRAEPTPEAPQRRAAALRVTSTFAVIPIGLLAQPSAVRAASGSARGPLGRVAIGWCGRGRARRRREGPSRDVWVPAPPALSARSGPRATEAQVRRQRWGRGLVGAGRGAARTRRPGAGAGPGPQRGSRRSVGLAGGPAGGGAAPVGRGGGGAAPGVDPRGARDPEPRSPESDAFRGPARGHVRSSAGPCALSRPQFQLIHHRISAEVVEQMFGRSSAGRECRWLWEAGRSKKSSRRRLSFGWVTSVSLRLYWPGPMNIWQPVAALTPSRNLPWTCPLSLALCR
nr:translation initiation factor IF-2-like [Macaca fascicularis]